MRKSDREPSLFRKLVDIYWEQCRRRRALRVMTRQAWSFEFLSLMLVKAGKMAGRGLSLEITDRSGQKVLLTYDRARDSDAMRQFDDDIFNHLDDSVAVEHFIARHSTR